MRYLMTVTMMSVAICHGADDDLMIARQALAIARHKLSADVANEDGRFCFKLAKAMAPKSRDVTQLDTEIKNEVVSKPMVTPKLTSEKLTPVLINRAEAVIKKAFKKEVQLGYLANLYLRFAERTDTSNITLRKYLALLETYGIQESLDDAFERDYKLFDTDKKGSPAVPLPTHPLHKTDSTIAYECIRSASQLLAKEPKNELAKLFLEMGLHLRPNLITAIVMRDQISLGIKVKALPGGIGQEKLIAAMLDRAEYHQGKAKKESTSAHLSLLYYRMVERLEPTNRYALLGIVRAEKAGNDASLVDLLNKHTLAAVAGLAQPPVPKYNAESAEPNDREPNPDENEDEVEWRKVKLGGRVQSGNVTVYVYEEAVQLEEVDFYATVESNAKMVPKNMTVDCYLIGKSGSGKAYFIAKKSSTPVEELTRDAIKIPKLTARFGKPHRYFSWLVVLKDPNGKPVAWKALNSIVQNIGEKVTTFPSSRPHANGTYQNDGGFFTSKGEVYKKK